MSAKMSSTTGLNLFNKEPKLAGGRWVHGHRISQGACMLARHLFYWEGKKKKQRAKTITLDLKLEVSTTQCTHKSEKTSKKVKQGTQTRVQSNASIMHTTKTSTYIHYTF